MTQNRCDEDARQEIRSVLQAFDAGYRRRDAARAGEFVSSLFAWDGECVFIGTGDGEFVCTLDGIRHIVEGDWLYWGDVALDVADASIGVQDDFAWFTTTATWTREYDPDDVYTRALDGLRKHLAAPMPAPVRVLFLSQGPLHVLMQMERGERCVSPLRLTGVLMKRKGAWRFHRMQFSFPAPWIPDVRLPGSELCLTPWDTREGIQDASRSLWQWREKHKLPSGASQVAEVLSRLQGLYSGPALGRADPLFAEDCLSCDVRSYGHVAGIEPVWSMIESQRGEWDSLDLGFSSAAVSLSEDGSAAWVASVGVASKIMSSAELYKRALNRLEDITSHPAPAKVRLLEAVREVGRVAHQERGGSSFDWPLRFEAILTRSRGRWSFRQLQYSLPSDWSPPEVRRIM